MPNNQTRIYPTETVYKPHFAVSSLILRRLTCQSRGATRSVTIYRFDSVCHRISLKYSIIATPYSLAHPYLNRIQNFDHTRMAKRARLAYSIFSERKTRLVRRDIKRKDTACLTIILERNSISNQIQPPPEPETILPVSYRYAASRWSRRCRLDHLARREMSCPWRWRTRRLI